MELIQESYHYMMDNSERFIEAVQVHLTLSLMALLVSGILGVALGIVSAKLERTSQYIMSIMNGLRVIPSLAILILVLPFMGTGFIPALTALSILAFPPIIINTYLGFTGVEPAIIESAKGMGMNKSQRLWRVEFPLALPLIITGLRTSAVEVVASATLAAFIGGGGLGEFIINGLGMYNFAMLMVGAIPVAILAIGSEIILSTIEKRVTRYQRDL